MIRGTRWWALVALLTVLALMAAACETDDNDVADDEPDDDPVEEDDPADDDEDDPDDDPDDEDDPEDDPDDEADDDEADDDEAADIDTADLELAEEGQILVGSDLDFAPFEFIEDGEPAGFDIDLFTEIAERLDLEIEFQDASFDTIFTQLASDEFDAIISAITITEEREEIISFTDPYFAANQALVVAEGSDIEGVDDLDGAAVGAQAGTTGLDYANENFTESEIVEYDTYPAAFTALEGDQIDAVLADLPVASEHAEGSDSLDLVEEVDTDEQYGIGVPQESENLEAALSDMINEIIEDGTYEEIYGEWFEGDVPEQFQS